MSGIPEAHWNPDWLRKLLSGEATTEDSEGKQTTNFWRNLTQGGSWGSTGRDTNDWFKNTFGGQEMTQPGEQITPQDSNAQVGALIAQLVQQQKAQQ
jgi:hypothetical protein